MLFLVCPDDTEPLDSNDNGYTIEIVGTGSTDQDPEDAFESYLRTGLEIDDGDSLKLTSTCPAGFGVLLSFMMDVGEISSVTVTFTSSTGMTTIFEVSKTERCFKVKETKTASFVFSAYR